MFPMPTDAQDDSEQARDTVLIVDDTEINRQLYASALRAQHHVLLAASGREALRIVAENPPQLILLDVMMPEMDGFQTAGALRADPRSCNIPIIFLTALDNKETHLAGLALGAVDFLTKPIDLGVLRLRVGNHLERERLRMTALDYQLRLQGALQKQTETNNMLTAIFNAASDALLVVDSQLSIVNASQHPLLSSSDRESQTLTGLSLTQLRFAGLHGEPMALASLLTATTTQECLLDLPWGVRREVAVRQQPFVAQGGEAFRLLSLSDISERLVHRKVEQEAARQVKKVMFELSQQKYALDAHSLVSITDRHGVIIYVNRKFCEVTGYRADELVGQTHRVLKSDFHSADFYADMWQKIRSGITWQGEIANRTKSGGTCWFLTTIVPWLGESDEPYQFLAIATDISDRYRAQAQLAAARERELGFGAQIQNRLLLGTPPQSLEGISLACFSEASQGVDGDFYIFTKLDNQTFQVLTGDVMGKGLPAAMIAAGVTSGYERTLVEQLAQRDSGEFPSLATIMNSLHEKLSSELIELEAFVTMTLLRCERQRERISWVNAGHTPALLARQGGGAVERLLGDNLPLGVVPDESYVEHFTPFRVGDTLLIYSDGLSESMDRQGEQYGEERIARLLQQGALRQASPSIILSSLRSDIHGHTGFSVGRDDSTAVIIQYRPLRSPLRGKISERRHPEHLDLERDLGKLLPLRQRIAALCADQDEDFTANLTLAAFESATNIIRHTPVVLGKTPITAILQRTAQAASVELIYEGPQYRPDGPPEPDFSGNTSGGFGRYVIEECVDSVSYDAPMPGMASIRLVKRFPRATEEFAVDAGLG